jgi:hypothetical protein
VADSTIKINRAPVFTLWASVVAERLGFDADESLSLAKALAGLNAQSKGRRLGIYNPVDQKSAKTREMEAGKVLLIELLGRPVPAVNTEDGVRATLKGQPVEPESVQRYLNKAFGENLEVVRAAMVKLAKAYKPAELATAAFGMYEAFRPAIPAGVKGWGAAGELKLAEIERLAKRKP